MKRLPILLSALALGVYFSGAPDFVDPVARAGSEITAALDLSVDGKAYRASDLEATARYLVDRGVAPKRARTVIVQLVQDRIPPDEVALFARMALRLGTMNGQGVGYSAYKLAAAFNGRAERIRRLDEDLNFLTVDQYERMTAASDAGDFPTARRIGLQALASRLDR